MRAGRKKSNPLLRQADPGYQSWTIVDRPQDRETYQDGDRALTTLWNDRPYSDVEQPHQDADPDIDAEDSGEPAKRLGMEPVVRRAVMELLAGDDDNYDNDNENEYRDESGAFNGPLWEAVAPLVNAVLDLMRMAQDADQLKSNIESSSIRKKKLLQALIDLADKAGFGYRTDKKDWDTFMEFVPSVAGLLNNEYNRNLLKNALDDWVSEKGMIKLKGFAGAPEPDDWEFTPFEPAGGHGGTDTQEYYEGYVPGAVPRQETYNVERIVDLAKGKTGGELVSDLRNRMKSRRIIDFSTAEVNIERLQSLLRYVVDQPDSQLAMSIVVAAIVREVFRYINSVGEDAVKFDDGNKVRLAIDSHKLLSGMQDGTKHVVEEWLNIATSIMSVVGVLPMGEPEKGEEDAGYYRADMPRYRAVQDRMRNGLAKIALDIATQAFQSMRDGIEVEDSDVGLSDTTDEHRGDSNEVLDPRKLRSDVVAPVRELEAAGKLGNNSVAAEEVWEAFDDEIRDGNAAAAAKSAQRLYDIASALGASSASLAAAASAISRLKSHVSKSASMAVADIAKRIIAPAKVRVVTQDEAEDGIELPGGETLELPPSKRCAERLVFGRLSWLYL